MIIIAVAIARQFTSLNDAFKRPILIQILDMNITRDKLEQQQIWIYVVTLFFAAAVGILWNKGASLVLLIEPVIGILLYSMFCQIPFLQLKKVFQHKAFFKALLVGNFIIIPILVWILSSIFLTDSVVVLGVFLVLLTPCIDYVIVFTHLGKGDSQSILAATPFLFILQMLLLPLYLWLFIGKESLSIIELTPFVKTFFYLIVIPFILALLTQLTSKKTSFGKVVFDFASWLPVLFMALTLFVVVASQMTILIANPSPILTVLPVYLFFHATAPFLGLLASKIFKLQAVSSRTVAFSTSTRNSLVVLPMALALPAPNNHIVASVIVTQTLVELVAELIYIKAMSLLIK